MAIRLNVNKGFQKMIEDLELSAKDSERVAISCCSQSAQIMQSELKNEMQASDLDSSLATKLPPFQIVKTESGKIRARVGFKSTPYNPRDISDYFKAIFANYGTPYRTKHGIEKARGFVERAKRTARPKIRKEQKTAFKKILERL